jgi:hypothetical protein
MHIAHSLQAKTNFPTLEDSWSNDLRAIREMYGKVLEIDVLLERSYNQYQHKGVWIRHIVIGASYRGLLDQAKESDSRLQNLVRKAEQRSVGKG